MDYAAVVMALKWFEKRHETRIRVGVGVPDGKEC